jgi:hypothetical protein
MRCNWWHSGTPYNEKWRPVGDGKSVSTELIEAYNEDGRRLQSYYFLPSRMDCKWNCKFQKEIIQIVKTFYGG